MAEVRCPACGSKMEQITVGGGKELILMDSGELAIGKKPDEKVWSCVECGKTVKNLNG